MPTITKSIKIVMLAFISIASTTISLAQAPSKMSFQAVVRDADNKLVSNQTVSIKISILKNTIPVYTETQSPESDAYGLIALQIGTGTVETGSFADINWNDGTYFIKTEIDPLGGSTYTIVGTSEILSVPYAMHAKTVESVDFNDITSKPTTLAGYGIVDAFTGDYNDLRNKPESISDLELDANGKTITNLGDPVNANDAVSKKHIQFTVSATGDTLHIGQDQFIIVPGISNANK